jgi:hypothetical protein
LIDYATILSRKFDAEWILNGDEYDGLTWLSNSPKPTKKQLDELWPKVQNELKTELETRDALRQTVLQKLGLTADELKVLLG